MEDCIVNVSSFIKYNCEPTGLGNYTIMYKSKKKRNKIANEIYTEIITVHVTINENKLKNQRR